MAKVLLVNPVIRQDDRPRHVPFGLAQLAAIIAKAGHKVQVFDCNAWRPTDEQIRDVLRADDWQVMAIGGLVTSYGFIKSFVSKTRKERPDTTILLGGGVISPIPREVMTLLPEVDIGIIGEGYKTFPEVLERIDAGASEYARISGIAWRRSEEIVVNAERELLDDVDSLPFPAWDFFPLDIYFNNSSLLLSEEAMAARRRLEFCCSYGCPFKCKYCFHLGLSGELSVDEIDGRREVRITRRRKVRWHSPEYVVELTGYARERFGIDFVNFLDENFMALNRFTRGKWMDEFEHLWIRAGLQPACAKQGRPHDLDHCKGIHWGTTCHAAMADPALLKRLKRLGCSHLDFGFESFSNEVLKEAGKGATKSMNIKALEASMKAGIRAIPNQIIGFPNESFDSILESLDAWESLGIQAYPFLATPYPGSEWFDTFRGHILEQYGGDLESFLLDLGDATSISAVISENFNAVELLGLRELMVRRDVRRIREYREMRERKGQGGGAES